MKINEMFHAIQGEGPESGTPTFFIRLSGCNLECSFCDTSYHKNGQEMNIGEVEKIIAADTTINHITFSGGEPTLQEQELKQLFKLLNTEQYRFRHLNTSIETNGTNYTTLPLDTIVVSPKKQAVDDTILRWYTKMPNTFFKFVYENANDLWWEDVVRRVPLPRNRVYIMPEGATREEQTSKMPEVMEYCLKTKFHFSARLHVLAYNQKRGV